jgi:hypothetical protein
MLTKFSIKSFAMKITHLFFLLSLFLFAACGDDDSNDNPNLLALDDGQNFSAPELDAGQHELAVYFPASTMAQHVGKQLIEVEYYAGDAPDLCRVQIHGPGTATSPGEVISGQSYDVTTRVAGEPSWKTLILNPPLDITGEDLWIGLFVNHTETKQTIGCDNGPRVDGGDWIWSSDTQTWETFIGRTGTERVNWNIRGVLE